MKRSTFESKSFKSRSTVEIPAGLSLRASSPIWASEASLARTLDERAAKPRGAARACNHPLQIFICTSPGRGEIPLAEK